MRLTICPFAFVTVLDLEAHGDDGFLASTKDAALVLAARRPDDRTFRLQLQQRKLNPAVLWLQTHGAEMSDAKFSLSKPDCRSNCLDGEMRFLIRSDTIGPPA